MSPTLEIASAAQVDASVRIVGAGTLRIGPFVVIEPHVTLDLGGSGVGVVEIGTRAKLKQGVVLRNYNGTIHIGPRVSVGEYSVLHGHGGLVIGATTIIAGHCYFAPSEHIMASDAPLRFQGETARGIVLEDDVWIGAHVTVQDHVRIGSGTVIGSGSVVTRSMPPQSVCFGSPCRFIRKRDLRVTQAPVRLTQKETPSR